MGSSVKPIIGRVGGKARLAPWIIEHLKRFQWSIYCEPFVGSGAVYFRLVSEGIFEQIRARGHHPRAVLNDADSRIVQLFRACRDYPEALAHAIAFTPYSREEHRLAQGKGDGNLEDLDEIEEARRYLVDGWMSTVRRPGCCWNFDTSEVKAYGEGIFGWHSLPTRILNATDHLKRCYIENDDAVAVIERWATPHTCIYADPPYVGLEDYYAHNKTSGKEDSLDLHYRLAAALNTVEAACVAVSYYPCDLVDELYPEEHWERHYKETVASSAGITRQSKTRTRPKRQELLLIRKHKADGPTVSLSGQLGLF
jgi:DNA adenine methylase